MKKLVICIALVCIISMDTVFAADTYYVSGDTDFSIRIGSDFPFLMKLANKSAIKGGMEEGQAGMSPAITGSLSYEVFLNSYFAVGGEIGYQLNFSRADGKYFTQVPITFKASYVPVQTGKFDLAINANAGYAYIKYYEVGASSIYGSLTVTPKYYFGSSWGVGIETGISAFYEYHQIKYSSWNGGLLIVPASVVVSYRH